MRAWMTLCVKALTAQLIQQHVGVADVCFFKKVHYKEKLTCKQ